MKTISKIFITGDTHSVINFKKIREFNKDFNNSLTKKDVLIICGDFGFLWQARRSKEESYWLKWLDARSWTTCFVDGNHENFDLLDNLIRTDKFRGEVGIVGHSIFHLLRGQVYRINDQKVLTMGGAECHDAQFREWGKSMWHQESITDYDILEAFENIKKHRKEVDIIISHCAPTKYAQQIVPSNCLFDWLPTQSEEQLQKLLDYDFGFKMWFFGHYHEDSYGSYENKWVCCFDKIHEVQKGLVKNN